MSAWARGLAGASSEINIRSLGLLQLWDAYVFGDLGKVKHETGEDIMETFNFLKNFIEVGFICHKTHRF